MQAVIIYKSISGFTEKYATWIAEELKSDLYNVNQISAEKLSKYDIIIFGGSLHAVGINGINIIKENLPKLTGKKIVIFAVGASPARENVLDEVKNKNFSAEEQNRIEFFYLRGGFNYKKLDFTYKVLMSLMRVRILMKKNKSSDDKGLLASYTKPLDCTKKENIKPIIDYIQTIS